MRKSNDEPMLITNAFTPTNIQKTLIHTTAIHCHGNTYDDAKVVQ